MKFNSIKAQRWHKGGWERETKCIGEGRTYWKRDRDEKKLFSRAKARLREFVCKEGIDAGCTEMIVCKEIRVIITI
jgi:hypothetical protein